MVNWKRCFKPGGMVSHWLPVREMSPFEARTIIRACQEVFPNTYLWQGSGQHLILLACEQPLLVNFEQFLQRWTENQQLLQQYGLDSAYQMLVDCLRMPDELRAYVAQTPALSDNNSYEQWEAEGSRDLAQRANASFKKQLADYELPSMDVAVDEAILDYVNRRKGSFADSNI